VILLLELIAFFITLTVPGYLFVEKYFSGLEKAVLSVFFSLSITSFFYYFVVSFFGISKELIYFYALALLLVFFVIKKPNPTKLFLFIKQFSFKTKLIRTESLPELLGLFILVLVLCLSAFFIPINKTLASDDLSYHLPIIYDIAEDGKKTFFVEPYNIYQLRSNSFPLLFESFVGTTKFFLGSEFFWFVSFFALILSLFLIYFISKQEGYTQLFSVVIYALSPFVLLFSRYFYTDIFLSLFFLSSVFFVLKYVKDDNLFFLGVAGFCSGLMFLTKFTGGIFFVGLLLFLLFKRKFKPALFFTLIFVLVSSVFFVSHLNFSAQKESIGGYGEVSNNLSLSIPSNLFKSFKIIFTIFSAYFYLLPIMLILGVFWIKPPEKNFLFLMLFTFGCFLLVTVVTEVTSTGFYRYFLPIYSLLCIYSGFQLNKIFFLKNAKLSAIFGLIFVLFTLILSVNLLSYLTIEKNFEPRNYYYLANVIENDFDVKVWFVNWDAIHILDKPVLYDHIWKTDFSGDPCDFLKKNKINYLIYLNIEKESFSEQLDDFGLNLKKSLLEGNCSEIILQKEDSFSTLTAFKIH